MKYSVGVCALSLLLFIELPSSLTQKLAFQLVSLPSKSALVLPCLAPPELSEASISWKFTPQSPPGSPAILLRSPLSVQAVGKKDEGTYTCVITGWKGDSPVKLRNSYTVMVFETSGFEFELLGVAEGDVGKDVELPCSPPPASLYSSHSGSSPTAVWYIETQSGRERLYPKEGETNEDGRVRWASPTNLKGDWSVIMSNVTMEDSGVYQCEWAGGKSQESQPWSHKVELTLKYPPTQSPPQCLGHDAPWEKCPVDSSAISGRKILQESLGDFSFKLYSHIRQSDQSKNMLFSPISIFWMLTHLLLGARGTTQETLERAVSIPHSFACLHKEMKSLREEMRDSVEIASKIYHSPEFKLNQIFINQSQLFYDAVPEKLTNDSERNAKMINDWVADKTNNKITDLMDSVSPTTILMLLNTVYFNGKWKVMFDKKMMTSPFVTLSGDMITVPVLYSGKYKLSQRYNTQVKAQVAAFPLSGRTVLYILLPKSSSAEDLEELEKRLNEDNVREMVKELDKVPKEVTEVTLPKIKLSIKTDLMEMLDTLGLTDLPFEPNLCGLSSEERVPALALSEAQHRAFLSLTEQGVEAGAASSISFSRSFSSFSALRPFVLLLWNEQIKSPLFLGRVTEP
ncbi:plasma protease C1 inhibitor [Conger conger]|uniref:plasma protease C1 inhibitor n=1 Tax=Conger conger TaxID=82655 RepID=UPI002A59F961|nr:plasma protease C1 inhibitor [Conger conger]